MSCCLSSIILAEVQMEISILAKKSSDRKSFCSRDVLIHGFSYDTILSYLNYLYLECGSLERVRDSSDYDFRLI
jgi:hypothetical protein